MVLHPNFYETRSLDRAAMRSLLGLAPHTLTGVVLFGGHGSKRMLNLARQAMLSSAQMIFLCGHNRRLADQLRALRFPNGAHVEGFTENVSDFMRLGDFFVGKPGSGSISEAVSMGLPVIVESGPHTLANERYNIEWIREQGLGLVIRRCKELPAAIEQLADPGVRGQMRRRARALNNRAVFEVVEIVESILYGERPDLDLATDLQHESS